MKGLVGLVVALCLALFIAGCYAEVSPAPRVYAPPPVQAYGGCFINGLWYPYCYRLGDGHFRYYHYGHGRWYYHRGPGYWHRNHQPPPHYRRYAPPPRHYRAPPAPRRHQAPPAPRRHRRR